jgi:hypothetical protein
VRRIVIGLATAAIVLLTTATTAWAGGWAIVSFDTTPGEFVVGETQRIGYTVLQHGRFPVDIEGTEIRVHGPSGDLQVFRGVRQEQPGRYVAEVTFPAGGAYEWEVTLGPFAAQSLGVIEVGEAPAVVAGPGAVAILRSVLPVLTLIGLSIVAVQLLTIRPWRPVADAG